MTLTNVQLQFVTGNKHLSLDHIPIQWKYNFFNYKNVLIFLFSKCLQQVAASRMWVSTHHLRLQFKYESQSLRFRNTSVPV